MQALARQLCAWLNIGLLNIQTASEAATAAAASALEARGAQWQLQLPGSEAAAAAADEGADSTDADEVNDACFTTPVLEEPVPGWPADAAGSAGATGSSASIGSSQQHAQLQPVTYVNRGAASSSDSDDESAAAGERSVASAGSVVPAPLEATPAAEAAAKAAAPPPPSQELLGGGATVEMLEALMMPEFDASMAPFVRWRSRPRFQVPPPPRPRPAKARRVQGAEASGGARR